MTYLVETTLCYSLQQGKFCYVAQPLDSSNSTENLSLCKRTSVEMENRGYCSIVIQAQSIVTDNPHNSQDNWDQKFIQAIWHSLHSTDTRLSRWLETTAHLSHRDRLTAFASDLLLNEICAMPFVILIESIDALCALPSAADDVFAWIEHCYELRDTYLTYHHLSFAVFSFEIIDQTVFTASDFPSHFKGIAETSRHPNDFIDNPLDNRANTYFKDRSINFSRNHSQNVIKKSSTCQSNNGSSVLGQSQYARDTTKAQLPAHRFRNDPTYCSYFAC